MKDFAETCARIDKRRHRVLGEIHPALFRVVQLVILDLGGRLTPWEGYRDQKGQESALRRGTSETKWGESPHNFKPALAIDLVLDPRLVQCRPHAAAPETPDLWDDTSPQAKAAWIALEAAAQRYRLERVRVHGRRDHPHLQLQNWRSYIPQ
jgi:hypothetical protein